jgi:hypothetical protein
MSPYLPSYQVTINPTSIGTIVEKISEENLMLIWPAAYTHAHRGNPVYGKNSKYIVTGWFYYD